MTDPQTAIPPPERDGSPVANTATSDQLTWTQAVKNTSENKASCRFPEKTDVRVDGILKPHLKASFRIMRSDHVFTIGSCFAREIEEKLLDFDLPSREFSVPKSEWPFRPNGILNEYNPGTISQRILFALNDAPYPDSVLAPLGELTVDLSLPGGAAVKRARAVERRDEIRNIYRYLASANVVIITLGLIESWIDTETGFYLNRMPPLNILKTAGERYKLHVFDINSSFSCLDAALNSLLQSEKKVILTVSPVPLQTTFTGVDAVIANAESKATLRVCAGMLTRKYANVDYFPSYEMVTQLGAAAFAPDNVHVMPEVVDRVTKYMLDTYLEPATALVQAF